jgi:hypothetical protein
VIKLIKGLKLSNRDQDAVFCRNTAGLLKPTNSDLLNRSSERRGEQMRVFGSAISRRRNSYVHPFASGN